MQRMRTEGWMLTLGLSVVALVAAALVPRLMPQKPVEPDISADVCLRLGPYECCYKEDDGK
ncbi:MAG: hypothetical protein H6734_17180 [Alphaproteobacteria bacterium]|nr:hypothetical protein [Alphaproteobacteria bacterium]